MKVGQLQFGRAGHTATLLPNARILVAGDGAPLTIELIEAGPVSAASTVAHAQPFRRLQHPTATLLPDGAVLLIGGTFDHDAELWGDADVSLYRPDTLQVVAQLHDARTRHTSTLLADGRVLVTGGEVDKPGLVFEYLDSAEIVSADGSVRRISPMCAARTSHTATRLHDGRVLIVGGIVRGGDIAELFDPATESFRCLKSPALFRESHTATLLQDGRVLIAGGTKNNEDYAEIFDPATGRFTATALSYPHDRAAATLLRDGTVLLAGGPEVVVYDPRRDAIVDRVAFGVNDFGEEITRQGMTATLLADGSVLLTGGTEEGHWPVPSSDIWRYRRSETSKRRAVGR
jgi:hypothetical protein